ncbi:hypothetical protein ACX3O0_02380 [Homoserinimonas sp. A447]
MEPDLGQPVLSAGRILLLSVLAAFVWLVLSIFAGSTPAAANDDMDTGSLLGTLAATVNEVVLPAGLIGPEHEVEPVAADVVAPVVTDVATPVLEVPIVAKTMQLLNGVVADSADSLGLTSQLSESITIPAAAAPSAVVADQPEPVAVALTSVALDTGAAHVPAAGSHHAPPQPMVPTQPVPAPPSTPNQGTGAPTLVAAMPTAVDSLTPAGASAAWENFTLPSSPTFDSDTSPG